MTVVVPPEPRSGIPGAGHAPDHRSVSTGSGAPVQVAVDRSCLNPWTKPSPIGRLVPGQVVIHIRASSEMTGAESVAHAEPKQRILQTSRFAHQQLLSAMDRRLGGHVSKAAKCTRITRNDTDGPLKELNGTFEILLVIVKVVEHARRERCPAPADQQVCIAVWREVVGHHRKGGIAAVGREHVTHGNRVDASGPVGHDAALW